MKRLIGYARPTRDKLDLELQLESLHLAGVEKQNIYIEETTDFHSKRVILIQLQSELKENDVLIVHRLEIIGKSVRDLLNIINIILSRGCEIKTLEEKCSIDTSKFDSNLLIHFNEAVVSYDKAMNREKTRIGLQKAKERGQTLGRKRTLDGKDIAYIKAWKAQKTSKEIYEELGISKSTYYRNIKELDL